MLSSSGIKLGLDQRLLWSDSAKAEEQDVKEIISNELNYIPEESSKLLTKNYRILQKFLKNPEPNKGPNVCHPISL